MEGTVLWDVCTLSENEIWLNETLAEIKEQRPHLKSTSDKDWISGKRMIRNMTISTDRSKKIVIGFQKKRETAHLDYISAQVIDKMLKTKQLESKRLIPVKLCKDADIPCEIDVLNISDAREKDFKSKLFEALDVCGEVDTACQVNVKNMILNGLRDETLREHLEKNCSVNIIEDNEPVSDDSFEIEWDCYIVSCDDNWEAEVCAMLKDRNKNLKVTCRKDLIRAVSIKTRRKKIKDDDGVLENLLQPVFKTKKTIVGFSGKINGYLTHIAEAAIDRQFEKGDYRGMIPVMIHRGAVIPFIAKQLRPLKAFDATFDEDVWKAVNEIKCDCYIVSCDNEWEEDVRAKLKNRNNNLELICRKDLMFEIPTAKRRQKKTMDILLQPVHNTKKTIIGFSDTEEVNTYLTYIAETVIERQCKRGDDYRELIPVMRKNDAVIPLGVRQFQPLKAFVDTFDEDVWNAVNEITYDCYIVSFDNEWENEVSAELKKRNTNLKLICRKEIIPDISAKRTQKTLYYGGVTKTLLQPMLNSKKTIVGFSGKINGCLENIAEAVIDRQCYQGDDVAGLIPVMIKQNTNISCFVKQFRPLKAFEDTFYEDVLRALNIISVQVKVSSTTNSALGEEIEKVLHERVEDRQNVFDELTNYLTTIGLHLTRYTTGSIILHISTHDSAALKRLENSDVQKIIMSKLAKILPRKLQKEFCQQWSMNIDKNKDNAALTELEIQPKKTEKQPTELKRKRICKRSTQARESEKKPIELKRRKICKPSTQAKKTEKQPTELKRNRICKRSTQARESEKKHIELKRRRICKPSTQAKKTEKQPTGLKRKRIYKTSTQDQLDKKSPKSRRRRGFFYVSL